MYSYKVGRAYKSCKRFPALSTISDRLPLIVFKRRDSVIAVLIAAFVSLLLVTIHQATIKVSPLFVNCKDVSNYNVISKLIKYDCKLIVNIIRTTDN